MCGRNSLNVSSEYLKELYKAENSQSDFEGSYNISPGRTQPVVGENSPKWLKDMHWGFVPEWTDKIEEWKNKSVINARSETVEEKNLFEDAVKHRRCLIPSTGFYEWKGSRGNKQPFYITWEDHKVMSFAGIYTEYQEGKFSFAILTQDPNKEVGKLHDRMPCILAKTEERAWLDGDLAPRMIQKIDGKELDIYPVTRKVNNPGFDSKKCIERKKSLSDF